jgi:hypothetical protein
LQGGTNRICRRRFIDTKNPKAGSMSHAPRARITSRSRRWQNQPTAASAGVISNLIRARNRPFRTNRANALRLDCKNSRICLGSSEASLLDALNARASAKFRRRRLLPFAQNVGRILISRTTRLPAPTRGQSGLGDGLPLRSKETSSVAAPIVVLPRLKDFFGRN